MWGRELRAGLAFVLVSLAAGGAVREWRRSRETRFQDLVERIAAAAPLEGDRAPSSASDSATEAGSETTGRARSGALARGRAASPRPGSVDLNRASREQLLSLPGIGPALAERIVADREARGPFPESEALLRVRGIGPRILERLRPYLASRAGGFGSDSVGAK